MNLIYFTPTLPATISKQKTISYLKEITSNPLYTPEGDPCYNTYTNINQQGFYKIVTDTEVEESFCSEVNGNVTLAPDSLRVGDPFYRRINQYNCDGSGLIGILNFTSSSSIDYLLHDTGFQLLTLPVNVFNVNDVKIT